MIELVGLTEKADARVSTLSGGQRRRLDLALGVVGDPELVFLDEPTTGFDPEARRRSWDLIRRLRDEGKTILLTTHYMEEAQRLADTGRRARRGRIVAIGPAGRADRGRPRGRDPLPGSRAGSRRRDLPLPEGPPRRNGAVAFSTATPTAELAPVLGWAAERGIELEGLAIVAADARGRLPPAHRERRRRMSAGRQLSLLAKWTRVRLLIYLRTPRAAFFTFIFPLILLLLLNSVNGGQT